MSSRPKGRPLHYVAWLVGERLVRGVFTVVALGAVARHLAPAGFGVLNFALAVVALATPLAQFGLDMVLVRDLVKYPARTGALLGTSFVVRLLAGTVCAAVIVAASHYSRILGTAQPALGPLCLILVIQAGEVSDCWFRSRVQSRAVVLIRGSIIVVGACVKLWLVAEGAGLVAFAWVYFVEAAAFALGVVIYSRCADDRTPPWEFDYTMGLELIREGWGFALAGFIAALAIRMDQVAVEGTLGDAAAGLYYGALRIMEIPILAATATAASLFPALANADDEPIMHNRLENVFGVISLISWITAIGATLTGKWLVPLVLGRAYASAWPVLAIHGWTALFFFSSQVRSNYLALRRAPIAQAVTSGLSLLVQMFFNFWLVSRYGLIGAATAFLLTQLFSAWVLPLIVPQLRPCLAPQARGLIAPWRPSKWREFISATSG